MRRNIPCDWGNTADGDVDVNADGNVDGETFNELVDGTDVVLGADHMTENCPDF